MKHPFFPLAILTVVLSGCFGTEDDKSASTDSVAPAPAPVAEATETTDVADATDTAESADQQTAEKEPTTSELVDEAMAATGAAAVAVKDDVVASTTAMYEKVKSDERVVDATEAVVATGEKIADTTDIVMDEAKIVAADVAVATGISDDPMDSHTARASAAIKTFGRTLKGELKTAMSAGGAVNAITVCNEKAPDIAADVSAETGYMLSRVSLKNRHPEQAASGWNKTVLETFEARLANGETIDTLVFNTIVTLEDGSQQFRMMQAIPTGQVCLNCHGSDIKEPVKAKLDELYPNDMARDYKEGDIRGAFVVTKNL